MRTTGLLTMLFLMSPLAWGAEQLNWNVPTTYEDGRPLSAVDVKSLRYRVYIGDTETGTMLPVGAVRLAPPIALSALPQLVKGKYFTVSAILPGGETMSGEIPRYLAPGQVTGVRIETAP